MEPSSRRISSLIVAGTLCVSTAPVLIMLTPLEPAIMSAWRMLVTALVMLPFALVARKQLATLTRREKHLLPISGVLFGLHFLCFIGAFEFTSFESAVLLLAMQPIFAAFLAGWILKERTTLGMWIASGVAMIGMGILGWQDFLKDHEEGGWNNLIGDALVLLGGVVIVLAIIIGRRVRKKLDFPLYTVVIFGVGGAMNLVVALALGEGLWPTETSDGWMWLAFLILLPTIGGHNLFNYLVRHVRVFFINLVILAEPVLSMFMRWLINDARLGVPEYTTERIVGSLILIVGVFVGLMIRERKAQEENTNVPHTQIVAALPEP
ncbi:MAG: DMT family transporter [Planctomycetes bacterium]|nr:DMT family transporter [Planctomycetota bacterium]